MRFALAILITLAAGSSADAQARFVNACIANAESSDDLPFDPDQVCGCAASGAMASGVAPGDLDRLIDYVEDDNLNVDALPESMQAVGASVMESLMGCALSQGMAQAMSGAMTEAMSEMTTSAPAATETQGTSSGPSAAPTAAAPARVLPSGLRTGNGGGTVRTSTPSPGGAIRIIG